MTEAEIEAELEAIRREAARLADYDLTIPGGRAATKLIALAARERQLRAFAGNSAGNDPAVPDSSREK